MCLLELLLKEIDKKEEERKDRPRERRKNITERKM
jgi:hypothetical protein